jgi:hypothetical protein
MLRYFNDTRYNLVSAGENYTNVEKVYYYFIKIIWKITFMGIFTPNKKRGVHVFGQHAEKIATPNLEFGLLSS